MVLSTIIAEKTDVAFVLRMASDGHLMSHLVTICINLCVGTNLQRYIFNKLCYKRFGLLPIDGILFCHRFNQPDRPSHIFNRNSA